MQSSLQTTLPGHVSRACRSFSNRTRWSSSVIVAAAFAITSCAPQTPAPQTHANFPDFLGDPIEPVNRGVWAFNRGVLQGVIHPTSKVYRKVVPEPARTSVNHFGRNICYPGRVINEMLQGRWKDAGDESLRFLANTTVGVAGCFDPATRWNIPKPNADFGQTFRSWGWEPKSFVMLPILGPSDESSALGAVFDEFAEPWNYSSPLRAASYGVTYNRISEFAGDAVRKIQAEADPYYVLRLAWSQFVHPPTARTFSQGPVDLPTLQTLGVATMTLNDPEFATKSRLLKAAIPATGKSLPFNLWLQHTPGPLVYVAPGIGSHRLSSSTLAMAEGLYERGFSVLVTSSVFHREFMESASTAAVPGHPPTDTGDLLHALTAIDHTLQQRFPGQFTSRALVGCSMGAYQALLLAATETKREPASLKFDRYIAINPPVDLHHGVRTIDAMFHAPQSWPEADRHDRINLTVQKAAALALMPAKAGSIPPFDGTESKYLIGLTFRYVLRDAIFTSQSRQNLGVLKSSLSRWRREPAYEEILGFSFADYIDRFLMPAYRAKGAAMSDFKRFGSLKNLSPALCGSSKIRLITNRNDFLLAPGDLRWLETTLGGSRCKVFPSGGHLGNLSTKEVRDATASFLKDLK